MKQFKHAASLMSAILLTIASQSCTSDSNPLEQLKISGEKTYIRLDLNILATRADEAGVAGTSEEEKISTVFLYIFNNNDKLESGPIQISDIDSNNSIIVETTTGPKTIYAITGSNVYLGSNTSDTETTKDSFESAIINSANNALSESNDFVMVGKTKAGSIQAVNSALNITDNNRFEINLERLVAKVELTSGLPTSDGEWIKALSYSGMEAVQTNTKMKLFSDNNEISSEYSDANNDGTYDGYEYPEKHSWIMGEKSGGKNISTTYIPENIVNNPLSGNTTYLILQYGITPTKYYVYDTWHCVEKNVTNSADELTSFYTIGVYDKDDNFIDFYREDGQHVTFFSTDEAATGYMTDNSTSFLSIYTYTNLFYESGTVYYRLNISDGEDSSKKYRVLRNRLYQISIDKINTLGMPKIDMLRPKNPETSLESTIEPKGWINTTFKVANWQPIIQNVEL